MRCREISLDIGFSSVLSFLENGRNGATIAPHRILVLVGSENWIVSDMRVRGCTSTILESSTRVKKIIALALPYSFATSPPVYRERRLDVVPVMKVDLTILPG